MFKCRHHLPFGLNDVLYRKLYYRRLKRISEQRKIKNTEGYSCFEFDQLNCLFVHIPKCAGLSICKTLFGNLGGGHSNLYDYKLVFGRDKFESYFKFTFVRNPWDRLLSSFLFLKQGGISETDRDWANLNLVNYVEFDTFVKEWVTKRRIYSYIHFVPQFEFLSLPNTRKIHLDFVGKFENIEQDYQCIAKKLNIDTPLIHKNSSRRKIDYREFYTPESMMIVRNVYDKDIRLFGYEF